MDLITVRDLFKNTEKYAGAEVNVGGWVRNRRGSKQFGFIVLNDGTYFTPVQVVYNDTPGKFSGNFQNQHRRRSDHSRHAGSHPGLQAAL